MPEFSHYVGCLLDSGHTFKLGGRKYLVRSAGVQAVTLAIQMLWRVEGKSSLMPLRAEIRALTAKNCSAVLTHLIEVADDRRLRIIAIWLRGRCRGHIGTHVIAGFAHYPDERTRVAVAKALRQLNDWNVLRDMSTDDESARVRRLASPRNKRAFRTRLVEYSENVAPTPIGRPHRFLYLSPSFVIQQSKRIRSVQLIREVLERIRYLVHGGDASKTD
jgi:hypothetical protein